MKRKLISILGIIIVLYTSIINTLSSTKIAFSTPCLLLGLILIVGGVFYKNIAEVIESNSVLKRGAKVFKILIAILIALLIIIEAVIISYPKHNDADSDYIMVLGAGLSNGTYPSLTLSYRLDAAAEVFNDLGQKKKIVVSGGQGSNEDIPEGVAMEKYLVDKGIPTDMILVEKESINTRENFKFSKDIIEADAGKSIKDLNVKIVTTDFHAFRSRIIAKKGDYGQVNNYSSDTVWYLIPVNYFRESFAVVKSLIFD